MNYLESLRYRIFGTDPEVVAAYQTILPKSIEVAVKKDGDFIIAKINKVGENSSENLLITQAKNLDELVDNVNDLMYTYINMPTYVRPYYGNIFQPTDKLKNFKNPKELTLVKA